MTYEKSILIPFDLYQRCHIDKDKDVDILLDKTIPSDKKLKLYHQSVLQKQSSSTPSLPTSSPSSAPLQDDTLDYIIHNIPDKDKPYVRSILDIIKSNPIEVNWSANSELILDNNIVRGSNLINLLLYFTNNLPVTRGDDVPLGANRLYQKLLSLGMPTSWVKVKPPTTTTISSRIRKRRIEDEDDYDDGVKVKPTTTTRKTKRKRETVDDYNDDNTKTWTSLAN